MARAAARAAERAVAEGGRQHSSARVQPHEAYRYAPSAGYFVLSSVLSLYSNSPSVFSE